MNFQHNFRMNFLIIFTISVTFLIIPLLQNIYAEDVFSKRSLSNSSQQNIDTHYLEDNNNDLESNNIIPDQFIVYLQGDNKEGSNSIDPLEFYNSELKDTGTELLQVYNNVAKGFAIKVPNEKVLEELKINPLVEYIGQDKKISAFKDSPMEIQVIPESAN
jgi:hypothetical protein